MSWRSNPNPCVKPPFGSMIDPGHPLAKGLVGCWVLNEDTGLFINDLSCNGHNGIIHGATWKNGLGFNGTGDYADLGIVNSNNHLTISAQVYLQTLDDSIDHICTRDHTDTPDERVWQFRISDNKLNFIVWNTGGTFAAEAGATTLSLNTWYNFTGTWDGTTVRVYVNEAEDGPGTALNGTLQTGTAYSAYISGSGASDPGYIHAIINKLSIYNDGLLARDIEWLHAEPYCFITWPSHRVIFDYGAVSGLSIPVAMSNYLRQMGA